MSRFYSATRYGFVPLFTKDILITEHAYDPRDDRSLTCGVFCVQFITVKNNEKARAVINEWKKQCFSECNSNQDGLTFGDQMYLNDWPDKYGEIIHILEQKELILGPWNADYFGGRLKGELPVCYHFPSFRIINRFFFLALVSFRVSTLYRKLYYPYFNAIKCKIIARESLQIDVPYIPYPKSKFLILRIIKRIILKNNIFLFYR